MVKCIKILNWCGSFSCSLAELGRNFRHLAFTSFAPTFNLLYLITTYCLANWNFTLLSCGHLVKRRKHSDWSLRLNWLLFFRLSEHSWRSGHPQPLLLHSIAINRDENVIRLKHCKSTSIILVYSWYVVFVSTLFIFLTPKSVFPLAAKRGHWASVLSSTQLLQLPAFLIVVQWPRGHPSHSLGTQSNGINRWVPVCHFLL